MFALHELKDGAILPFPKLSSSWFTELNPVTGYLTVEEERKEIIKITKKFTLNDNLDPGYTGQRSKGKRSGYGIEVYTDGGRYEGMWKDDQKHGEGICYFPDGCSYEGQWLNDKRHGKGNYYYIEEGRYGGDWEFGKKHGFGIFYFSNGDRFEGNWEDGKKTRTRDIFLRKWGVF